MNLVLIDKYMVGQVTKALANSFCPSLHIQTFKKEKLPYMLYVQRLGKMN